MRICHAVIWCKSLFGNQSSKGQVATARLLTVARTCVIERRNALEFLSDSVRRHRVGQPALSLLPRQRGAERLRQGVIRTSRAKGLVL